jgi:hypothetical protein
VPPTGSGLVGLSLWLIHSLRLIKASALSTILAVHDQPVTVVIPHFFCKNDDILLCEPLDEPPAVENKKTSGLHTSLEDH